MHKERAGSRAVGRQGAELDEPVDQHVEQRSLATQQVDQHFQLRHGFAIGSSRRR